MEKHALKTSSPTASVFCILVLMASLSINIISIIRDHNMDKRLNAYRHYYNATETMLDSIEADGYNVQVMLETDAGANYLDEKYVLDSLLTN